MAPRVWLITGASSGFGLELALIAAARGDKVVAATRSPQKLEHLKSKGITPARLDHNEPLPKLPTARHSCDSASPSPCRFKRVRAKLLLGRRRCQAG